MKIKDIVNGISKSEYKKHCKLCNPFVFFKKRSRSKDYVRYIFHYYKACLYRNEVCNAHEYIVSKAKTNFMNQKLGLVLKLWDNLFNDIFKEDYRRLDYFTRIAIERQNELMPLLNQTSPSKKYYDLFFSEPSQVKVEMQTLPNRENTELKTESKEKIKIPTKLLFVLIEKGYIADKTHPYKWIKKATRNKLVSKSALFELLDLLGCFKGKGLNEKIRFINDNFLFNDSTLYEKGNANRQNVRTEFYEELKNLVEFNVD